MISTASQHLQIDIVSDTTLQLILEKLPLVEFWCNIKEHPQPSEKAVKTLLLFQPRICVRPDFLHMTQSNKHTSLD